MRACESAEARERAATRTDPEGMMPSELGQTQIPCDFTYIWNPKNTANQTNKAETDP